MFEIGESILCINSDEYGLVPGNTYTVTNKVRGNDGQLWVRVQEGPHERWDGYYHSVNNFISIVDNPLSKWTVDEWIAEVGKHV